VTTSIIGSQQLHRGAILHTHILFMVNFPFNAVLTKRLWKYPFFLIPNHTHSFSESCICHGLHILVTALLYCNQKAQDASVQSFTLWQQWTIDMCHNHSIIACLCHLHMDAILHAHPVVGEFLFITLPTKRL